MKKNNRTALLVLYTEYKHRRQKLKARLSNTIIGSLANVFRESGNINMYNTYINCLLYRISAETFTFCKTFRNNEGEYFFGASFDFYWIV